MRLLALLLTTSLMSSGAALAQTQRWSEPTQTQRWSEPTQTQRWSEPTRTPRSSAPGRTQQWSEPTRTERWVTSPRTQRRSEADIQRQVDGIIADAQRRSAFTGRARTGGATSNVPDAAWRAHIDRSRAAENFRRDQEAYDARQRYFRGN